MSKTRPTGAAGGNLTYDYSPSGYEVNKLNQYQRRTVPGIYDLAAISTAASVTVSWAPSGSGTMAKQGQFFFRGHPLSNGSNPVFDSLTLTPSGGSPSDPQPAYLPATPEPFTYDDDGNLTRDGRWVYQYDAENRLIAQFTRGAPSDDPLYSQSANAAVWNSGLARQKLLFSYDYLGRRVSKLVANWGSAGSVWLPAFSLKFVYNGWNLMAEFDALSTLTLVRSHTWGLDWSGTLQGAGGVGGLAFTQEGGNTYLPMYDGNGNVMGMVKASTGSVDAAYEYDAFGNTLRESGTFAASNPFRFSTKYTDIETGLVYYGHRYYAPWLGRFVCRDPIEESGGINLYAYVRNNAINKWDYLGWSTYGNGEYRDGWGYLDQFNEMNEDRAVQISEEMGSPYTNLSGSWAGTHVWSDAGREALALYNQRVSQAQQNLRLINDAKRLDNAAANGQPLDPKVLAGVEAALMAADVYNKPDSSTAGLVPYLQRVPDAITAILGIDPALLDNASSGFHAGVYFNQRTNDYVIAFRGTQPGSFADWGANLSQAFGFHSGQYDQAVNLARIADKALDAQFMRNLMFTGHSLGGGLASVASIKTNNPAITFNAAGLSRGTINRYGLDMSTARGLITAYYIEGDILSFLQDVIPGVPSAAGTRVPLEADQLRAPIGVGKHTQNNFIRRAGGGSGGGREQ